MDTKARKGGLRIEGYAIEGAPLGPANPLPYFRDPEADRRVAALDEVPASKREALGRDCGFRVLPWRMQDDYGREKKPLEFKGVVLENEFLRATFLPELGGRLVSLVALEDGRELLSRNPVFQPANLAIRNAWFSGGIEWNVGHFGHSCHTCSPVFAARVTEAGTDGGAGYDFLRIYDFERQTGLFWQIDFRLPPGSPLLLATTRVVNPLERASPLYWWTNIAVPEEEGVRVLAPAAEALYLDPTSAEGHRFGYSKLPRLPSLEGEDATYPLNSTFANEFFFQCEDASMPWEAAVDRGGRGFFECSTHPLSYRKIFCWGSHSGGRHWQDFLAEPGIAYLEIQGGVAPTQLHGASLAAGASISWTQAFGSFDAGPSAGPGAASRIAAIHGEDWKAAIAACEDAMRDSVNAAILSLGAGGDSLAAAHGLLESALDAPVAAILHSGEGWGALEATRLAAEGSAAALPAGLSFPPSTMGAEEAPWLSLLEKRRLPESEPEAGPGAFMVSPEWKALLEASLALPKGAHWLSLYHAGAARLEAFDEAGAEDAWARSLGEKPSAWAMRDLAVLAARRGRKSASLEFRRAAWRTEASAATRTGRLPCRALAEELLAAFLEAGMAKEALDLVRELPPALADGDRIRILAARASLELGLVDEAEAALEREFAVIREGENDLTDLWFEIRARRLAENRGLPVDADFRAEARREKPPARIDFRMGGR